MASGIKIDVGFVSKNLEEYISSIQKKLESVDFGDSIGLTDAFNEQIKTVKKQLKELQEEIQESIGGKIPKTNSKQLSDLSKSVNELKVSYKSLIDLLPDIQKNKINSELDGISDAMNDMSETIHGVTNAVSELSKVSDGNISFVNKKAIEQDKRDLIDLYKSITRTVKSMELMDKVRNKTSTTPFKDADEVVSKLEAAINNYFEVSNRLDDIDDDKISIADNQDLASAALAVNRLGVTYISLSKDIDKAKSKFDELFDYDFDSIMSEVDEAASKAKSSLEQNLLSIENEGFTKYGIKLLDMVSKGVKSKTDDGTIPLNVVLDITTTGKKLANKAIERIEAAQLSVSNHPLEVEISLISANANKENRKRLRELLDKLQLNDAFDKELADETRDIISRMTSNIEDALSFDVKINSDRASKMVSEFKEQVKDEFAELTRELPPIEPEVRLSDKQKQQFREEISRLLGIFEDSDVSDTANVNFELTLLGKVRSIIDAITSSVNEKTNAFIEEYNTVGQVVAHEVYSLQELFYTLLDIENQIKDIDSAILNLPKFKIEFDKRSLNKLLELKDSGALDEIINTSLLNNSLKSAISDSIQIPNNVKNKLIEDINDLSDKLQSLFTLESLNIWSSTFIEALNSIASKLSEISGNKFVEMSKGWREANKIIANKYGTNQDLHQKERGAWFNTKTGYVSNPFTYGEHSGYGLATDLYKTIVEEVNAFIHTHPEKISSMSLISEGLNSGDLISAWNKYLNNALDVYLTQSETQMEIFDAKGFFDKYQSTFYDSLIWEYLLEEFQNATNAFSDYLKTNSKNDIATYVRQFASINTDNLNQYDSYLKTAFDGIFSQLSSDDFIKQVSDTIEQKQLSVSEAVKEVLNNSIDENKLSQNIGKDAMKAYNAMWSNADKINEYLYSLFSINKMVYQKPDGSTSEKSDLAVWMYQKYMQEQTASIIEKATQRLAKENNGATPVITDWNDFAKIYNIEEFYSKNPLGLSSQSFDSIFNISSIENFKVSLDKVLDDLKEIISISDKTFEFKIDSSFGSAIQDIIDSVTSLSNLIKRAFNVSSDFDIFNQFEKSKDLLSSITNDKGNIDARTNAFKEFIAEYQKYLDMGGENDLSKLTDNIKSQEKIIKALSSVAKESIAEIKTDSDDVQNNVSIISNTISIYPVINPQEFANEVTKQLQGYSAEIDVAPSGSSNGYNVSNEDNNMSKLTESVIDASSAVDVKTDAFKNEEQVVESVVNSEISNLYRLSSTIEEIANQLQGIQAGNITDLLKALGSSMNLLGGSKSAEKIQLVTENLQKFKNALTNIESHSESKFLEQINNMLAKGNELKSLADVVKATEQQINSAQKSLTEKENLNKANEYIDKYGSDIRKSVSDRLGDRLYFIDNLEATKEGFVKVTAVIQEADGQYAKYVINTVDGSNLMLQSIKTNQAQLQKTVEAYQRYEREKENAIPGAHNLGEEAKTFTSDSSEWDALIERIHSFGIELEDIQKILRNVDRDGKESFQIFTDLSRITIGVDSETVLWQKDEVYDQSKVIKQYSDDLKQLEKLFKKSMSGNSLATQELIDTLERLSVTRSKLEKLSSIGLGFSDEDLSKLQSYISALSDEISRVGIDNYPVDSRTPEFSSQIEKAKESYENFLNLLKQPKDFYSDTDKAQIQEFISDIQRLYSLNKDKQYIAANVQTFEKTLRNINAELNKNSGTTKELKNQLISLKTELELIGPEIDKWTLSEIQNDFVRVQKAIQESGKTGISFLDLIGAKIRGMSASLIAQYMSLYDWIRYLRQALSIIIEIDTAMTELRKVSNASEYELTSALKTASKISKELGASIADTTNIMADWSRLGYNLKDAEELARVTTLYLNVGDNLDADSASSYLISTLQGFQKSASEAESIVDEINEVANNYAIDTQGIGEALTRSAASMNAAHTSLEETLALITTANAVVQDPDSVGTVFKTLSARIRGAKTELEELGEEEDDYTKTTSKLRDLVKGLTGFDIMEDEDTFKSIYDIMLGIGKEWKNLTDAERASLGEALAGKRNANALYAVMQNIDQLENVYTTASNAAGSAAREQENYEKSIEYSLKRIQASAQSFIQNLIDSDLVKFIVDVGNGVVELGDKLLDFGSIPFIATILSGASTFTKNGGIFSVVNGELSLFNTTLSEYKNIVSEDTIKQFNDFNNVFQNTSKSARQVYADLGLTDERILNYARTTSKAKMTQEDFTTSLKGVSIASKVAAVGLNIAAMAMNAIIGLAIGWGMNKIIEGLDNWIHKEEKLAEATEEAKSAIDDLNSSINSISKSVNDVKDRYAELAQNVKDLGKATQSQGSLNNDEYAEFLNLSNQLSELFPQLTSNYTENGDAILELSGDVDTIVGSLNSLVDAERTLASEEIVGKLDTVWKSYSKNVNSYTEQIKFANDTLNSLANGDNIYAYDFVNDAFNKYGIKTGLYENRYIYSNLNENDKKNIEMYVKRYLAATESALKKESGTMAKYINTWLGTEWTYLNMSDNMQKVVSDILINTNLSEAFGKDWETAQQKIREELLATLDSINDENLQLEIIESINGDNSIYEIQNTIAQLREDYGLTDDNRLIIHLQTQVDKAQSVIDNIIETVQSENIEGLNLGYITGFLRTLDEESLKIIQQHIPELLRLLIANPDDYASIIRNIINSVTDVVSNSTISDVLSSQKEKVEEFISALESAYTSWQTLNASSSSASEILSALLQMQTAVEEMGGGINWEFVDSGSLDSTEMLSKLIDKIATEQLTTLTESLKTGDAAWDAYVDTLTQALLYEQKVNAALTSLNTNIDGLQSSYSSLTDIVEQYNSTHSLTWDQIQSLIEMDPEYLNCLEIENNQMSINKDAVQALTNARLADARALIIQQACEELSQLQSKNTKTAIEENGDAFEQQVEKLSKYNEELAITCAEALVGAEAITALNNSIQDAEDRGADSADIDAILNNAYKKMQALNTISVLSLDGPSSSSSNSDKDFDWIKVKIERLESEISKLDEIASSAFTSYEEKLDSLAKKHDLLTQKIELQTLAAEKYKELAEEVDLDEQYKQLVREGGLDISTITDSDLKDQIERYQERWEAYLEVIANLRQTQQDKLETTVSEYETSLGEFDRLRDNGLISEKQYIAELKNLYNTYYKGKEGLEQQYRDAVINTLNIEKSYLESVASAAASVIQKQIDDLEKQRDAQIEPLEDQIKLLEKAKEPLQDQLDDMEKQREAREEQLAVEQALYNLRRAENQREKLTYTSGQGMVYKSDDKAIKDARDALDDAEYDVAKRKLQDQIDALDDQIDQINKQVDAINENYDKQIKALEKIKNAWQEAIDDITNAQNIALLKEYFGDEGAITKLLSGEYNPGTGWTKDYIQNLKDLSAINGKGISNTATELAALYGLKATDFVSEFDTVISKIDEEEKKALAATDAIRIGAEQQSEAITTIVLPAISQEIDYMNAFNDVAGQDISKTVTINYQTNGYSSDLPEVGGTGIAAAKGFNNDLIGEKGREIWVHTQDGTYDIVDKPTMVDLKPDDVVLNNAQTEEVLKRKKGRAFANGNAIFTPLAEADPERYNMLNKITHTLTGNNGLVNMISNLTSTIKDVLVDGVGTNQSPTITFGDINVSCTGVTSQEVVQTISDTLEKSFSGLALNAYQRSKASK